MEVQKLRYPIGQQDFAGIREEGKVYVDKTGLMYDLVKNSRYVFLSRPRRFGKSLLLSTIRYYFEGRKDLFEGLKIMDLENDWKKHPVLHLELGSVMASDPNGLRAALLFYFRDWEEKYGIRNPEDDLSMRFRTIIQEVVRKTGERVVILIDEYDNPLINSIHLKDIYEQNRQLLKSVYSNLKGMDEYIQFAMLTGVSRFSNMTIFSGLNNLYDITFNGNYSTICGFTESEIRQFLWPGVVMLSQKERCNPEDALGLLKKEYDGYHFSKELTDVYNPFSLLNCLATSEIGSYWMHTGVPEFLIRKISHSDISLQQLFSSTATDFTLSTIDSAFDSPVALFFQTGYLTIKGYDRERRKFLLGIPNHEVEEGLMLFMLGKYLFTQPEEADDHLSEMAAYLRKGNPEEFLSRLKSLLSPISYRLHGDFRELDFERTLYVVFHVLKFHVHTELETSRGRIDLLVETKDYIYVMELKLDGSAEAALKQIEEKDYALPWKHDSRKVYKIGINFSSQTRNVTDWLIRSD